MDGVSGSVAVVGLGAIGSMALLSLARRGERVVGFDRIPPGNDLAAYGGETRQLRLASHDGRASQHIELASESLQLWRKLEGDVDDTLYHRTGQLAVGPANDPDISELADVLESNGLEHEVLERAEVERRFPQHIVTDGEIGLLSAEAGVLQSNAGVRAAVTAAKRAGASVHTSEVSELRSEDDAVLLTVDGSVEAFSHVIVATGPWCGELVPQLRPVVTPRAIISTWFESIAGMTFSSDAFPPGFRRSDQGYSYTFIPAINGTAAKFVYWIPMRPIVERPSDWDREVDREVVDATRTALAATLRGVASNPVDARYYIEGFTLDRVPIVGRLQENVTVLTGFSGSGFAIAPVMGEVAADLAIEGSTSRNVSGMEPNRLTASS